ncbi:hypothetical protein CEXT_13761 [Caerostris extrusa]|uniref:C2H2-type domain-containing protein n=1 Tax=Caerostris extrusa TaxID=172846 RepID=A0AAV4S9E2_CAEEX|nr:hypothetical protein CEXT_13761 [Caerostris extrusa]
MKHVHDIDIHSTEGPSVSTNIKVITPHVEDSAPFDIGPTTGPPRYAPFPKIVPAKTWSFQENFYQPIQLFSLYSVASFAKRWLPTQEGIALSPFRAHKQPISKSPIKPASSSSSHAADASYSVPTLPGSTSPATIVNPDEPQIIRGDTSVTFNLPLFGAVQCPDCTKTYTGKEWYSMKGSVIKHLKFKHKITISTTCLLCSLCKTYMSSMNMDAFELWPSCETQNLNFQCNECSDGFSTFLGLRNHLSAHKKIDSTRKGGASIYSFLSAKKEKKKHNPRKCPI